MSDRRNNLYIVYRQYCEVDAQVVIARTVKEAIEIADYEILDEYTNTGEIVCVKKIDMRQGVIWTSYNYVNSKE